MTRFVCLLLVSVVACSQVRGMTLKESCSQFCPEVGVFMQGNMGVEETEVVGMMHQWLKSNDYMDRTWDCEVLWEIIQRIAMDVKKLQEEHRENSIENMTKEMKKDIQEIMESFWKTMVANLSKSCKEKLDDLWKQIV